VSEVLFRLAVLCPSCRRRPAVRVTEGAMELARGAEPDTVLLTYQCPSRGCHETYPIAAVAFQHAEPDPPPRNLLDAPPQAA
jgi:hypothetical protein